MTAFKQALEAVAARVPEVGVVMVMANDGIPIERLIRRQQDNLDAVAAEYTTLLRSSASASADTGLGELRELVVASERTTAILVAITGEYFLFATLPAGSSLGKIRHALRLAALKLESEFA